MKHIYFLLIFIISSAVFSQTGPGGVGTTDGTSNLVLWLDANNISQADGTNIASWSDLSGTGNNATVATGNEPVFETNIMNSYPTIRFTASNTDYLSVPHDASLNPTRLSYYIVGKYTNSTSGYSPFLIKTSTDSWDDGYGFVKDDSGDSFSTFIDDWGNDFTDGDITVDTNTIIHSSYNANKLRLRYDDINQGNTNIVNSYTTSNNDLLIGISPNNSGGVIDPLDGDISEIIVINTNTRSASRIIISNYLSAKYDIDIRNGIDYFDMDDTVNGDFDHNVAGIGQKGTGTNLVDDSQGTGIIRINNPSSLLDDDFLFWGEETKNATYNFTTNTSDYLERLNSKWRVSKRNDLGTVSLSIDETDLDLTGKQSCATLRLIVSNSSTFATKTSYDMTLSSGVYTATAVNFTDADYFTLEYQDLIVLDGTQFYNGSGTANRPDTTDGCYKLLVKNTATGTLTLTADSVVREVEVENGGKLVIDNGLNFEVTDAVQLDGEIRLIGSSQLLQTHTGTSQVTGTGSLYMDKKGKLTDVYQSGYWSSPVVTSGNIYTIAGAMKDGIVPTSATSTPSNITFIDGHDGATTTPITLSRRWLSSFVDSDEFNVHQNENEPYNPGEGYNIKSTGNALGQNYTFVGKPNDGDYSSSITYGYFSLLGNPYPSTLDADQFLSDNTAVINTLYFWDGENDNSGSHVRSSYQGGYATYVSGMGTPFGVGATPNQYVSVGQGFFVYAFNSASPATRTITFNNGQRFFDTSSSFFGKSSSTAAASPFPILRIGLDIELPNNEIYHRQLGVGFRGLTNNFDAGDAYMLDFQASDFALTVNDAPGLFVIAGIEDYSETLEIPLRVYLDQQRNLTFKIDAIENFSPTTIFLKDAVTNQFYNLENDVNLTLPSGDYVDRFFITFNNGVLSTENEDITATNILISDDENMLNIKILDNTQITNVSIYTILGQTVLTKKTNSSIVDIPIYVKSEQLLLVKIELENGKIITKKLFKK